MGGEPYSKENYRDYQPRNARPFIREGIAFLDNTIADGDKFQIAQVQVQQGEIAVFQHYSLRAFDADPTGAMAQLSEMAAFGKVGWTVTQNQKPSMFAFNSHGFGTPTPEFYGMSVLRSHIAGDGAPTLVAIGPSNVYIQLIVRDPAAGIAIPASGWNFIGELQGWYLTRPAESEDQDLDIVDALNEIRRMIGAGARML